jgi:hypothetical protein
MDFFTWLEGSSVGLAVRETLWVYPFVISCHAVGMGIVVGLIAMVSVRALGFAPAMPIASFDRLIGVAWAGVALNLISGLLLFTGDAVKFVTLGSFQLKILLILLGVISSVLLLRSVRDGTASPQTKPLATLSLLFWFGAVIAGRATAYI